MVNNLCINQENNIRNGIPTKIDASNSIILKILVQHKILQEIIVFGTIVPQKFNKDIIFQLLKHKKGEAVSVEGRGV